MAAENVLRAGENLFAEVPKIDTKWRVGPPPWGKD